MGRKKGSLKEIPNYYKRSSVFYFTKIKGDNHEKINFMKTYRLVYFMFFSFHVNYGSP